MNSEETIKAINAENFKAKLDLENKSADIATKIKAYWEHQAEVEGPAATTPDPILKEMEIAVISKRIGEAKTVLDVGCGNGYSTIIFAKLHPNIQITGVDYSEKMIEAAKISLSKEPADVQARVSFKVGDVTALEFPAESFDIITTDRCLINLITREDHVKAVESIRKILKSNGKYLMCECSEQGLKRINELRSEAGLSLIPIRWHNLYLDEETFFPQSSKYFKLTEVDNFSSLYYIASRVFNAKLSVLENKEPDYNHPINRIASMLTSFGDCGPLKLFVLTPV